MKYFISGHLDLTQDEFEKHYKSQIDAALCESSSEFVIGDATGADLLAQQYLFYKDKNVTIYHIGSKPRNLANHCFSTHSGFKTDELRDEAMTQNSDIDIAWVRVLTNDQIEILQKQLKEKGRKYNPSRVSGTEKNLIRRNKKNSNLQL